MIRQFALVVGLGTFTITSAEAQRTVFGQPGTGQPTNTVVGVITGAAAGAAIGQAAGGHDGWWIGSLVGSVVGGAVGNSVPTRGYSSTRYYSSRHPSHCDSYVVRPAYTSRCYKPSRRVVYTYTTYTTSSKKCKTSAAPYGYILDGGMLKSPWSDFTMTLGGKHQGQVLYDSNTGQPFIVP